MSKEDENIEVVRKAIQALNNRDVEGFLSYFPEDGTSLEVSDPEPIGIEEFRPFLEQWLHAYPDAKIDTQNIIAEGDRVVVENLMSGTFENDLGETKATGRFYQVREAVFFDMEAGKIKAERIYLDQKTINEQLGIG